MIFFTYNIPLPANITNMLGKCLDGLFPLYVDPFGHAGMTLFLTNTTQGYYFFPGYSTSCSFDSNLGLPSPRGSAGTYDYWVTVNHDFYFQDIEWWHISRLENR
jgi:hypothetical protein